MARIIEIVFSASARVSYPGESYGTKAENITSGSISWELNEKRYHIWVERNAMWTPEAGNKKWLIQQGLGAPAILFCNPPHNAKERGLPDFRTRRLVPDAAKNAPMVELALAFANSGALEADAERQVAAGMAKIAAEKKADADDMRKVLVGFLVEEQGRYQASGNTVLVNQLSEACGLAQELADDSLLRLRSFFANKGLS